MYKLIVILVIAFGLNACASRSVLVTGSVQDAIDMNEVVVYLQSAPKCDFDVVAQLEVSGETFSRVELIDVFKQNAAQLGATGVHITFMQKVGFSEYMGSARAIRCTSN